MSWQDKVGAVDRRQFLKATAVGSVASVAGVTRQDGQLGEDVGFRLPIDPSANYVISFVAQKEGFWEDEGIVPLTPEGGNGSGDTTRRIATGENVVGHAAVTPQVSGLAQEGFNILQFGTSKAMTQTGLVYRTDRISDAFDPDEVAGATITTPDTLDEQTWILFREGIGAPENVEVEYVETSSAASLLQQGEIDGFWDSINDYAAVQAQVDVELGFAPLYAIEPLAGYYLIVNSGWLEEGDDRVEWVRRLMQGYSQAGKWTLLNPESAIELMVEEVPELGTVDMETHLRALAAGVAATNFNEGIKNNGFGYIDPEVQQNTFDTLAEVYDLENVPSAEEVTLTEVTDDVELATFSDDEWSQVEEFASPYTDFYQTTDETTETTTV